MKHTYEPIERKNYDEVPEQEEARMPTTRLSLDPSQMKGLSVGDKVTVTLEGTVESMLLDTDDSWGTGADLSLKLETSEVVNHDESDEGEIETQTIDSFLEDE